ncbi:deoxyribose-phosphate aldolase [Spirochaeta thermophila]|uniref:Deoxyribose-phosphate aldolase n=1 Tax=Winmispira thermophila (strain ATCC 49972 / DSM 6192 / RI 19.B1) TaxID=665571 RepID=E0RP49_WINT6|nr:deoxyribose-phosphate aldolase [Spirochaeta thermophila]ADN02711.1 predicted deoxyribose-phosphate aldolase [Spirochaeta thermophila DSM 6192]
MAEQWTKTTLAKMIDHTLLKPTATRAQIEALCDEAVRYGFASVCVNSWWVPLAAKRLSGSGVMVCTVVGFPLGAASTEAKAYEAAQAVVQGAREVDMVINLGLLKGGEYDLVREDIRAVVDAAAEAHVKVIIEACYLSDEEKRRACLLAEEAGAHFVKTSTGFGPSGATVEDVRLMREVVGESLGVKAAGGIRSLETALAMIEAGASRLGTSSGVSIVAELK